MKGRPYTSYNYWFYFPFFIWVVIGAFSIMLGSKEALFRFFNTNHRPFLDSVMPYITMLGEGTLITIVLSLLLLVPRLRNWWYVSAALSCTVLSSLLTQSIKSVVDAQRPLSYFNQASWIHILPDWEQNFHRSFPSGHTCGAFAMFCLLACLLPRGYKAWGSLFMALGLLVAYSRIYLSAHFFADVYAGSIIGVAFTTFVISMLRRYMFAQRDTEKA